uniref:Uncharacterized protein n=1 Tax=Romanomermis culicivorax TaxID=13658 RepID=A0A915IE72_ROMCU
EFAEIPETDEIRRGEAVFNREQAKLIITKDYGFLVDEPLIRVKSEFAEISETDGIRRGEAVFNREQAKLIITKDYGFLVDEPLIRVKSLIKTWISKGFWDGSDAENDWRIFNSTLSRKAKYSFFNQRFNPSLGTWNSYQFIGDGTSDGRLSAAYAFLNLKCKGNHVTMTNTESDDLGDFVVYKNFKNFNKELASELARFSIKYDQCRSLIQSA